VPAVSQAVQPVTSLGLRHRVRLEERSSPHEVGATGVRPGLGTLPGTARGDERMHRTLIVARLEPERVPAVADIFAASDATDLPHMIGVSRRTLFQFHELYLHLVEADDDISGRLYQARRHPLYEDVNQRLAQHVRPYDPNWREPKDAMARPFYTWTPHAGTGD
jgi:cyclase